MFPNKVKDVLLAEDNSNDVELILAALQKRDIADRVIVVRDGVAALDYLYRQGEFAQRSGGDPAVILVDLKMPKVDGLEVVRRVRSDEQLKTLPIVILSSSQEERDVVECYQSGVNAYVVKPIHSKEFEEAVSQLGVFWALINEPPPTSGGGPGQ